LTIWLCMIFYMFFLRQLNLPDKIFAFVLLITICPLTVLSVINIIKDTIENRKTLNGYDILKDIISPNPIEQEPNDPPDTEPDSLYHPDRPFLQRNLN